MPREVTDAASPEVADDSTPTSVRRALDVVARHGYLAPEKLGKLPADDFAAIRTCVVEFMPRLAMRIVEAPEAGDRPAALTVWGHALGRINGFFDQEATWNLHALPKEEREAVRAQPVNATTWRRLQARSRWHMNDPHRRRDRLPNAAPRYGRHGRQTRNVRRRRVASSPRRARAPGRPGEPSEADLDPPSIWRVAA
jgi:hypothetical protein